MKHSAILIGSVFLITASAGHAQQPAAEDTSLAIATVGTSYSCDQADAIKFDRAKYNALSLDDRNIVDGQWNKCEIDKARKAAAPDAQPNQDVVIFTNPIATEEQRKVFWGLAKRQDIDNAVKNCAGAGKAAGIALTVIGAATGTDAAGQVGRAAYEFSGVSCEALGDAARNNDLMMFLGPKQIVTAAVQQKVTSELLKKVPFVSDADKKNVQTFIKSATTPPSIKIANGNVDARVPSPIPGAPPIRIKTKLPKCCKL